MGINDTPSYAYRHTGMIRMLDIRVYFRVLITDIEWVSHDNIR